MINSMGQFLRSRSDRSIEFVIYSPPYDANSGGVVALHELCARLEQQGHAAYIWPVGRQPRRTGIPRVLQKMTVELARARDMFLLKNSRYFRKFSPDVVVIYPENVAGNPLGAERVVRWLLHQPGYHTGVAAFGENDLFFFYQLAFASGFERPVEGQLMVTTVPKTYYPPEEDAARAGACVLLRKGRDRARLEDHPDAIVIDGLSHDEIGKLFRSCERLISYDDFTMYYYFAALCGCVPVVVPQPGVTEEEWQPDLKLRYGIAYGKDRMNWAIETRGQLIDWIKQSRLHEDEMVERFVQICRERFDNSNGDMGR